MVHGQHVALSAQNVGEWTPQLRDLLLSILQSSNGPDSEGMVRQAVALANQIRNGIDINGNENIEPLPGEGGAITAYQHAYYMADILIFPDSATRSQSCSKRICRKQIPTRSGDQTYAAQYPA